MTAEALGGSFRDPSGVVFRRNGTLFRQVNHSYQSEWAALEGSGLLAALWRENLLSEHTEVDLATALTPDAWKVFQPESVPFVSYPYEWCFGQLKDAAILTLRIQRLALEHGMILRDASAFNIQFSRSRPILIDTLSFGRHSEGQPWIAYRQFCQHFLVPLLLMSRVDPRLGLLGRDHLDGVPLDLGAAMLPKSTRWWPSIALHVHLHAASIRRHAATTGARPGTRSVSRNGLLGLIDNLASLIGKLDCRLEGGAWWDYEETHGYERESRAAKERLVLQLAGQGPGVVWDLGANTGRFAELLAPHAPHVVAMDLDHGAVERHWRRRREHPAAILPLVMDLTNPTPDLGWNNRERSGLAARGPADTLLALALIHHLAIANNVPFGRIAAWMAELGQQVIIEWVPKEDAQVQRLLASREDIFAEYREDVFSAAFGKQFEESGREPVPGSGRVLYQFVRR
jgi:hypothetical protein